MLVFTTMVSRKTPIDGRLEITASLAERLLSLNTPLSVSVGGADESVGVEEMPCMCTKASSTGQHVHHFLSSEALKSLVPETKVIVEVDVDLGQVRIESDD